MTHDPANVRQHVCDIISQWRKSHLPDARAVLRDLPELRSAPSLVVDLAYEEFCLRSEAGENVDTKTFCGQFPTIQYSLARMIDVHHALRSKSLGLNVCTEIRWPEVGARWLDWDLVEPLGKGAFSRVFLAREHAIGNREVVLKVTLSGPHEASILGQLSHTNIGPVYSLRHDDASNLAGISMPLLGRRTLADVLNQLADGESPRGDLLEQAAAGDRLPPAERSTTSDSRQDWSAYERSVIHSLERVARALAAAHRAGIMHGDIKPSNILLSFSGEPILLDFNLSGGEALDFSHLGGTPPYMAPERLEQFLLGIASHDNQLADKSGDLFSLGVVMLELLQGPLELQFELEPASLQEDDYLQLLDKPTLVGGRIEPGLQRLLRRCLAFDPRQRHRSADEMADEMATWLAARQPTPRAAGRNGVIAGASAILLGLVIVIGLIAAQGLRRSPSISEQVHRRIHAREFEEAALLLKSQSKEKYTPELWAWMDYCFAEATDYETARRMLEQAVDKYQDSAELWNDLGVCCANLRGRADAQAMFDKSIALNGRQQAAYHNRARARMNAERNSGEPFSPEIWLDFAAAIQNGEGSAQLHFDAAMLLGATRLRNQPLPGDLEEQVRLALAYGQPSESFAKNKLFFKELDLDRLEREARALQLSEPRVAARLLVPPPFPLPQG